MAVEMYLTISDVIGSCGNAYHRGWFEVSSCRWGLARERQRIAGEDAPRTITTGNQLNTVKAVGMESTSLMLLCASGKPSAQAQLSIIPVLGKREALQKYVLITMEDVYVKSLATAADRSDGFLSEELVLSFKKLAFQYFLPVEHGPETQNAQAESRKFLCDFAAQTSSAPVA